MTTPADDSSKNPVPTKGSILLVDDSIESITSVSEILHGEGFHVYVARSGKKALELVEKITPCLILLDLVMPEMDGLECCRILKTREKTKDIPVIFLSSSMVRDDISKGLEGGAVDYIFKPFKAKDLINRINTRLSLHWFKK